MLQKHGLNEDHPLITVIREISDILDGLLDEETRARAVFPDEIYPIINETGFTVRLTGRDGVWLQIHCEGVIKCGDRGRVYFLHQEMTEEDLWGEGMNRSLWHMTERQNDTLREILRRLLVP